MEPNQETVVNNAPAPQKRNSSLLPGIIVVLLVIVLLVVLGRNKGTDDLSGPNDQAIEQVNPSAEGAAEIEAELESMEFEGVSEGL